jgi:hypothetical protein
MKVEEDHIVFSTGKRVHAAWETIGIKLSGDEEFGEEITIHEGSVAPLYLPGETVFTKDALTAEECVELADAVIARWQEFKRKHGG